MALLLNWIGIILVGLVAAIFVAAEFSVLKVRPTYLKELHKNGNQTAKITLQLLDKLNDTLSTTQVAITFTGILMGAIGESTLSETLVRLFALIGIHLPENWLLATVSIIILTYLEVVLTELVPKSMAIDQPNKIALLITRPVHGFQKIAFPLIWLMNWSAALVLKALGYTVATESEDILTQAEILGLTRFPVMKGQDRDRISGYVFAHDLAKQNAIAADTALQPLIRPIARVAENMPINNIYRQMVRTKSPFALVVDEYGGTSGIVTDEDINEELLGNIQDENEREQDYVQKQTDGSYQVNAKMTLNDFEIAFKTQIPAFKESNAVTLAGFLLEQEPTLEIGAKIQVAPFTFTIIKKNANQHITWLNVSQAA